MDAHSDAAVIERQSECALLRYGDCKPVGMRTSTLTRLEANRNAHSYVAAIESQRMRTPTLLRLSASWDAHAYAAVIERQSGCIPRRRSRTARRARMAGACQVSGAARLAERSLCANERSREHPEGAAKRAHTPLTLSPAVRPPRRAPTPERRSVPYNSCFLDWKAVSYEYTRPTRRCSRPLRARDRWHFEGFSRRARGS